tara:strand:+ start:1593 stop:1793 length:201 start_codon:yes stop_codon:yes gene_type:complete
MKNKNDYPHFLSPTSEFVLGCLGLDELNEEFTRTRIALLNVEKDTEEQELLEIHRDQINEFRLELL